jgi:hypothetical protein
MFRYGLSKKTLATIKMRPPTKSHCGADGQKLATRATTTLNADTATPIRRLVGEM